MLLQLRLLLRQFLLLLLRLLLHRSHASLNVGSGLQVLAIELDGACHQLVLGVVIPLHLDLKPGHQNGYAHLLLTGMEHARHVFRHSVGGKKDDHISGVLSLDGHGGAVAPIDHSLDALCDSRASKQQDCRQ